MSVLLFSRITDLAQNVGGKAWGLAQLTRLGFQVPPGLVLQDELAKEDWSFILDWWYSQGKPKLAVRSSAPQEDSKTQSFAGQNKSFLNITTEDGLQKSIVDCLASSQGAASQAYRQHFAASTEEAVAAKKNVQMNVVIQQMIEPKFSGVFFSHDPREATSGWLLEVVPGFGENLVSGKVTPGQVNMQGHVVNLPAEFSLDQAHAVAELGCDVEKAMGYATDMEWAIDENDKLFVLQTRPITTSKEARQKIIEQEMERLLKQYTKETPWDGQTFSEWSGFPSYFTFSLWKNAFSPHFAFGDALERLGYESFSNMPYNSKDSLLERVFGRAYINLDRLSQLYYGPIPYRIEFKPRPQTRFTWQKINLSMIQHLPSALKSMVRVAWNLSVKRRNWLNDCSRALHQFQLRASTPLELKKYEQLTDTELKHLVIVESWRFSKEYLHWPLVLVVLMESTVQRIQTLLRSLMPEEQVQKTIRDWMAQGVHTITNTMREAYQEATANPTKRAEFFAKYGHRGPGEMDLSFPRWCEIEEKAFGAATDLNRSKFVGMANAVGIKTAEVSQSSKKISADNNKQKNDAVEEEIKNLDTFKREVILEEWTLLKNILELRESWKMELLKPYAGIRYALNQWGERLGLDQNIHWLRLSELEKFELGKNYSKDIEIQSKIANRKKRFAVFREFYFPELLTLGQIQNIMSGSVNLASRKQYEGQPLSSGIVRGVVRVVQNIADTQVASWPENTILVAESTDPGWTPLFVRARAIVVQNGGVLSHCAIVAREMGIPAVSGIVGCHKIFQDGDILWVDGNLGRISVE